ncbi:hypothetical protein P170DRAFT_351023 [Aspergillus steynii IBT 23096]|uniref:Glycoside hydrolase 131 catalytic N-terminal domain-containing protein n=1 Tax=Aspergillus steynii IBT 23096 TaxID=1392250 RepID=A0A2I2GF98_9EURO|nr:uncharacterized protein P170DRAFT_351023 [Aspergillus steynii IBT 23096]PLB51555.1 hypothetical protein P170DRAFT_351023 [Aspergillus steynii IBT 23096]
MKPFVPLLFPTSALAGSVLWSGVFNSSDSVADLDDWSWSNQVGAYQWYIHGDGKTSEYLELSSDLKNPAASDAKGLRTSIDGTATWNGQTMERTELIPQTSSDLGSGHLYYHFSLSTKTTNAPSPSFEHQIAFFESHFTELQYGSSGGKDNTLRWNAGGETQWSVQLEAGHWYNFAYDIDFDAQKVGLWASNGSDALTQVVKPVSADASSNSADWHVGVLRLPGSSSSDEQEDFFWSGVYVEEGPITTKIGSGRSSDSNSDASSEASTTQTSAVSASTTFEAVSTAEPTGTSAAASSASAAVTTSAVPTPVPTETTPASTTTSSASLPSPTTASELLADIGSLLKSLISRSGVHARDFTR